MRIPLTVKIIQLRLERNYGEAIRLLQADRLNSILILSTTRPVIRWGLL